MADVKIPDDLILPIAETPKEMDMNKALQDYTKSLNDSLSGLKDITNKTAGTGLTDTSDTFSVNVDDATIEINGDGNLSVKDGGIDTTQLASDAVEGTKIADDAVDSEHIAAGAVDLEHMSANSIDSDQYVDGSIDTVHIGDNQVTADKLADDLTFQTFPLTPSAAPDADYEVANKKYVDDEIGGISQGAWEYVTGGAFSGASSFTVTATISGGYVYKLYVQGQVSASGRIISIDDYTETTLAKVASSSGSGLGITTNAGTVVPEMDSADSFQLEMSMSYQNSKTNYNFTGSGGLSVGGNYERSVWMGVGYYNGQTTNPVFTVSSNTMTGRYFLYRTKQ